MRLTAFKARPSTPNGNHPAAWQIGRTEVVFLRLSVHRICNDSADLIIAGSSPQRSDKVGLHVAAKTRPEFSVGRQAELVAAFAKMQIGHSPDKTHVLVPIGDSPVGRRTVSADLGAGGQWPVTCMQDLLNGAA